MEHEWTFDSVESRLAETGGAEADLLVARYIAELQAKAQTQVAAA